MPKKARSKSSRYRRRKNPVSAVVKAADLGGLTETVVPGFAGYAATRFLSRVAYTSTHEKFPKGGRHIAAGAGVAAAGALLLFGKKIGPIKKWQEPLLIGAGVAAIQGLAQTYLPRYGWIVGDYENGPNKAPVKKKVEVQPPATSDLELEALLAENDLEEIPLSLPEGSEDNSLGDIGGDDGIGDYSEANDALMN